MDDRRRRYLGACASGLTALLAGCPRQEGSTPTMETATDTPGTATDTPTETSTPASEAVRWRVGTDRPVLRPPVVVDGTLYAVESSTELPRPTGEPTDHALFALSTTDGTDQWRVQLDAPAGDGPLVTDDRVYATAGFSTGFTGVDYRVVAVDRESGERDWTFENRDADQFVQLIATTGGIVLVGRFDDAIGPTEAFVSGLDAESGQERWRYETGDVLSGTADADSFYVGSPAGVYGLTAADGTARWLYADAAAEPAPVATGDRVYLSGDAVLAAVDPDSGQLQWRVDTGEGFVTDRVVTDEVAVIGTFDGWLRAVDASTGEGLWKRRLGRTLWSVDRRGNGQLVVVVSAPGGSASPGDATTRLVYAVTERTGAVDELFRLRDTDQLAIVDRGAYIWNDSTGTVTAVDTRGEPEWTVRLGTGIRTAAVSEDTIYVSTTDEELVALGA